MNPLKTSSYEYSLPDELIAKYPVQPADHAKLLVYNRQTNQITHTYFYNLLDFIPRQTHVFFNDTKVFKARIFGQKKSGGKIELLVNKPLKQDQFLVYIKGKVQPNTQLEFDNNLQATVLELLDDGSRVVSFEKDAKKIGFEELVDILNTIGHTPLPPYINREDTSQDEKDYQALFAKNYGAVAAPTASLHFTPKLLSHLQQRFENHTLTLHVGAGTFKPVQSEDILEHPMHSEYYNIPLASQKILQSDVKTLAVGTTVTRTIEYFARTHQASGECNLFLNPSNPPQRVDYLLTNFHLPQSTLIMLVASFVGLEKTLQLYTTAVQNRYRFFSYGDAMLII